jgi:hypothetical protein
MDSKEIIKDVNAITSRVNSELSDFYKTLKDNVALKKAKAQSVSDNSRAVRSCPILNEIQEGISEEDRQVAISTVKNIKDFVKKRKDDFIGVDIEDRGDDTGSRESGDGTGRETALINVGVPKWVQELENSVKSKFKRIKKREYFDVEGLHRGVTRKKKEKGMKKVDYVYFLLDVSGSMDAFSHRGVGLKALFASYIPPIAKKFDGQYVQVDGGQVIPTDLKDLSKGEIKSIILGGGGGANFPEAIEWVKGDIIERGVTNPIVIMASDSHEDFNFELLPNTIYITTDEGWAYTLRGGNGLIAQGFPNPLKGQKAIIIDIDKRN